MYETLQGSNTLEYRRHWNVMLREVVYVPSLEVFEATSVKLGKTVKF